jgi:hypothetical protein
MLHGKWAVHFQRQRPFSLHARHDESQSIRQALEAGAKGYVLKNQVASDLLLAIRQVSRGQVYRSPGVSSAVLEAWQSKSGKSKNPLTSREASASVGRGREIHKRSRIFAWHQRENSRMTSHQAYAEAGYSRDSQSRALRRPARYRPGLILRIKDLPPPELRPIPRVAGSRAVYHPNSLSPGLEDARSGSPVEDDRATLPRGGVGCLWGTPVLRASGRCLRNRSMMTV